MDTILFAQHDYFFYATFTSLACLLVGTYIHTYMLLARLRLRYHTGHSAWVS